MTKIFVISMDNAIGAARRNLLNYAFTWFKAADEPLPLIKNRMFHFWNASEKNRRGRTGCLDSYYRLFKKIYDEKLDDIIIAEDDCFIKDEDYAYFLLNKPLDICYLNGSFRHAPPSWKVQLEFNRSDGINPIDYKASRIIGTLGIYIPTYECVKPILTYIEKTHYKLRAVDMILCKEQMIRYYYYPSVMIHDDHGTTNIQTTRTKALIYDNYLKIK